MSVAVPEGGWQGIRTMWREKCNLICPQVDSLIGQTFLARPNMGVAGIRTMWREKCNLICPQVDSLIGQTFLARPNMGVAELTPKKYSKPTPRHPTCKHRTDSLTLGAWQQWS
ncbi:hypothetical protein Bbelb_248510 [Branchiostoma belcheri]|nr:hypothetical protein Bbelb_248510 [Branchiostoma belcheri]